ncbi:MAG: prepilin-type N-terminal cleavage/methylation domain-containing protein [Moraxellaceae bacterium]|nr:MAG: prepilin-type N-terminal cleavage/methylation domain-containing protein [Moraxellaceae bacterium]
MTPSYHYRQGFTLIELIAVLVVLGVVSVAVAGRFMSPDVYALQAARDRTLLCIQGAQQLSMSQLSSVRVLLSGTTLDVRKDANNDGVFASGESVVIGAVTYPTSLTQGVSISASTLNFNRLGETTATTITLTQQTRTLNIAVSATGFAR